MAWDQRLFLQRVQQDLGSAAPHLYYGWCLLHLLQCPCFQLPSASGGCAAAAPALCCLSQQGRSLLVHLTVQALEKDLPVADGAPVMQRSCAEGGSEIDHDNDGGSPPLAAVDASQQKLQA